MVFNLNVTDVSSAYKVKLKQDWVALFSFTYNINKTGASTEPCSTTRRKGFSETSFPMFVD